MENLGLKDRFAKHLGAEVIEEKAGYAKVKLQVQKHFLNGLEIVHGGVIFSLADYAFALASNATGETGVALNANINYIKAGLPADTLFAEIKEVSRSRQVGTYIGTVTNQEGKILAQFQSLAFYKNPKKQP